MSVIVTTSREPSQRVRSFCSEIEAASDLFTYINRGKRTITDLLTTVKFLRSSCLIMVCSYKGNPGRFDFYQATGKVLQRKLSLLILGVKLAREMGVRNVKSPRRPVFITSPCQGGLTELAEKVSKLMGIPVLTKGSLDVGLNIALEPGVSEYAVIRFVDAKTKSTCGPLVRLRSYFAW